MLPPLYKIVGPAGEPLNGGSGQWPLPTAIDPGAWWEVSGPVVACRNGLHLTDAEHLETWLPPIGQPFVIYRAEVRGDVVNAGGKWVAECARLLPRRRPMPNLAAIRETARADELELERRHASAIAEADERYRRNLRQANAARDAIVPPALAAYAYALGPVAGSVPKVGLLARLAVADAAYAAIERPARKVRDAAVAKANAEFDRAVMPVRDRRDMALADAIEGA